MVRQVRRAYSSASSSETCVYRWKYERGSWNAVSRSVAEPVQVPARSMSRGARVDVDGEVEVVGEGQPGAAVPAGQRGLEHVQALDDEDVGAVHGQPLARHDVVDEVRVDRAPSPPALPAFTSATKRVSARRS